MPIILTYISNVQPFLNNEKLSVYSTNLDKDKYLIQKMRTLLSSKIIGLSFQVITDAIRKTTELEMTPVCSMVSGKCQVIHILPSFPLPSFLHLAFFLHLFLSVLRTDFYFLTSLLFIFVCTHTHACTAMCTWRGQDNLQESLLSYCHVGPGG